MNLSKLTIGVGDRFNHGAPAQLAACQQMLDLGVEVVPVWNKSHREHTIIGSQPGSVRTTAEMGPRYLEQLDACRESIARNTTTNLVDRHLKPLFG